VPAPIIGRELELAEAGSFLDDLRQGPAALVLEGEAGIGKTTVWSEILERAAARAYRVLSSRPAEAETRLSFAALSDLLAPVIDETLGALPPPQRHALEVALLRRDPGEAPLDPRALGSAVLSVLGGVSRQAPVLLAIDDAQWIDDASGRVLEFALRRLTDQPVGVALSARIAGPAPVPLGLDRAFSGERLRRLSLAPLSLAALYHLFTTRLGEKLDRSTLLRIHDSSGGNPFYALEIARALLTSGARPAAGKTLPVPQSLAQLVAERIDVLTIGSRRALLFAAAASRPTVDLVCAASQSARAAAALARAADARVIQIEDGRISFTHPLLASTVYSRVSPQERRVVHRRLSVAVEDPEARAWHAALGSEGPDEAIARALDSAAARTRSRGAPETAAELGALAVELTPAAPGHGLAERQLAAAEYSFLAGDALRAEALLDDLLAVAGPGLARARALVQKAQIVWESESGLEAVRLCEQALRDAAGDVSVAAAAHSWAAEFSDFDEQRRARHAHAALDLLERADQPEPRRLSAALKAYAESELVLGRGLPMDAVERAIELEREVRPVRVSERVEVALGWWLTWMDDLGRARGLLEAGYHAAVEEGDESSRLPIAGWLRELELRAGNWAEADRYAREQLALAEQAGARFWRAAATRKALLDAHLGRVEEARLQAEGALRAAEQADDPGVLVLCLWAIGFLELSLGNDEEADRILSRADETHETIGLREPGYARFHGDHIEAVLAVGDLERAELLLERLEERAAATVRVSALVAAARCRALLCAAYGDRRGATAALERGMREHARLDAPFERGRTLLAQGRIHRRFKEKRAAREALEQAEAVFAGLGARLWAEKARGELGRIGLRASAPDDLTATENRVAELAASGLTNREIAARAFLAPKSVEDVLRRVYRKLGIHSRAELGARIAERDRVA
jgi:DNA-binding NarL/FixJ family response regulator